MSNAAHSFQFDERALQIVGGSSTVEEEEAQQKPSVAKDAVSGGKKGSPQPTPTAFLKNAQTESTEDETDEHLEQAVKPSSRRRPTLRLGMGSAVLNKLKGQSSRLLAALGPLSMAFGQLLVPTSGHAFLTKPAIYALALLGSSSGFYLFLYFITIGYCCGVTLPVLVAMIVYNVSYCLVLSGCVYMSFLSHF